MSLEIGILIDPLGDSNEGMIRGVLDYVRRQAELSVFKSHALPVLAWDELQTWRGDGLIALLRTPRELATIRRRKLPGVLVAGEVEQTEYPHVKSDNHDIGRVAAEHLIERGLRKFAYVGNAKWANDRDRFEGFQQEIHRHGATCMTIPTSLLSKHAAGHELPDLDLRRLRTGLVKLQPPVGILAAHHEFAHEVIKVCEELQMQVPFDAAVICVNDVRLICETTEPPISAITQQVERIGYEAAAALHRMLKGEQVPQEPLLIPPGRLVVRRSSDYLAIRDTLVRKATELVRARSDESFYAEDVARMLGESRRTLDRRFVAALGHPLAEEIRLVRIRRAKDLLATSDLPITKLALQCGFSSSNGFFRAFRQATGQSPLNYRRQTRQGEN